MLIRSPCIRKQIDPNIWNDFNTCVPNRLMFEWVDTQVEDTENDE